jgi:hypothetical protein
MGYSLQSSQSSAATTGPSASGPIGGTAWNIQGINLGTQYQAPATAGSASGGTAMVAMLGLVVFLTKR